MKMLSTSHNRVILDDEKRKYIRLISRGQLACIEKNRITLLFTGKLVGGVHKKDGG